MDPEVERRLELAQSLPTLPSVAVRIVRLGQQPEVEAAEIGRLISHDPALTARILRAANSGFYSQRRRVDNLRQAIMALGINASITLALSFTLTRTLPECAVDPPDGLRFWRRALMTAAASRCIGDQLGRVNSEELMLAGLLQDLGMLVLDAAWPEQYPQLLRHHPEHERLRLAERELLGTDHGEVGEWLMSRWQLPRYLCIAATGSHEPEAIPHGNDERQFLQIMELASRVAEIWTVPDREAATLEAASTAHRSFGWQQEDFGGLMDAVAQEAPDLASLFDLEGFSSRDLMAISDQAREALTLRNLHMIHEAANQQRASRDLEIRNQLLEEQAERDPLTELYNRRNLFQKLEQEFRHALDRGWPLTIAFLDLDHFKEINDRFGHQAGDSVLYQVAAALRTQVRQGDLLARYGGEEFLLALPGIGTERAEAALARLHRAVCGASLTCTDGSGEEDTINVTVSIGYAVLGGGHLFEGLEAMIRAADQALYEAKRTGRNRIVRWSREF